MSNKGNVRVGIVENRSYLSALIAAAKRTFSSMAAHCEQRALAAMAPVFFFFPWGVKCLCDPIRETSDCCRGRFATAADVPHAEVRSIFEIAARSAPVEELSGRRCAVDAGVCIQ